MLRTDNPTMDNFYINSPLRAENEALFDRCHRIGAKGGKLLVEMDKIESGEIEAEDGRVEVISQKAREFQHELHTINLEAMERIKPLLGSNDRKRCEGTILYLERQIKGSR